jgi:hypothetical protein
LRPKPKDLTSKKCLSTGTDRTLYIQCQQWESGQKIINIYKFKVNPSHLSHNLLLVIFLFQPNFSLAGVSQVFCQIFLCLGRRTNLWPQWIGWFASCLWMNQHIQVCKSGLQICIGLELD